MNYELNSTTPQEIITTAKTTENYVFQFPILNVLLWLPLYVLWIEHIRSCISLWTSLGIILFFCLCLVYPMLTVSFDCPLERLLS
jgi:Ca2+/Na+ antiporter